MKFGTSLPLVQLMPGTPEWQRVGGIEGLITVAKRADELGYAWLPCSDHVVVPRPAEASMGSDVVRAGDDAGVRRGADASASGS